ncbi:MULTISPECIES: hypothetical protein [Nocardia]|uniref:hypothetical protein n=1 Tax=Nocardia TaxID=1817 RepID=UPI00245746DB|nr:MULTISPECIES: hypothetical protein [Nocardia]
MTRLHIADRVAAAFERAFLHRDPDDTQPLYIHNCFEDVHPQRPPRPAYPPGWDWKTPEEWEAEHHGPKGDH